MLLKYSLQHINVLELEEGIWDQCFDSNFSQRVKVTFSTGGYKIFNCKAFKFNDLSNHVGLLPDILTVSVGKRNENLKISQQNAYRYITWGSRHWLIWIFLQESLELLTVTSMIWLDQGAQQGSQVFLWVYTSRLTVTAPGQNDR